MNLYHFYRDELKERQLMPALLAQAGIDVPHSRLIRVPSVVYDDTKPSAYVYPTHIVDYGDGNAGYDLLKVAREWMGLSLEQAVTLLCELAGVNSPVNAYVEVRKVAYRALTPTARVDPDEYATFAARAAEALQGLQTVQAEAAARYLAERELYGAAEHYRLGVVDSTVQGRKPGRIWEGMVTFPTWHHGQLLALKGRNLLPKEAGREMRNLAGTGTAPYGLREMGSSENVLVVEGETDVLSVWSAYGGEVSVIGIPGATHWKRLQHPALSGRRLWLCLDVDEAGLRAVREAQTWAADEGRPLTVLPGIGDKNAVLTASGAAELRRQLNQAISAARVRPRRTLR